MKGPYQGKLVCRVCGYPEQGHSSLNCPTCGMEMDNPRDIHPEELLKLFEVTVAREEHQE